MRRAQCHCARAAAWGASQRLRADGAAAPRRPDGVCNDAEGGAGAEPACVFTRTPLAGSTSRPWPGRARVQTWKCRVCGGVCRRERKRATHDTPQLCPAAAQKPGQPLPGVSGLGLRGGTRARRKRLDRLPSGDPPGGSCQREQPVCVSVRAGRTPGICDLAHPPRRQELRDRFAVAQAAPLACRRDLRAAGTPIQRRDVGEDRHGKRGCRRRRSRARCRHVTGQGSRAGRRGQNSGRRWTE